MSPSSVDCGGREALLAGLVRRAEAVLGSWLTRERILSHALEYLNRLLGHADSPAAEDEPRFERAAMVEAGSWVALAQPLPTAESRPLPHVVLWAIARHRERDHESEWPTPEALRALAAAAVVHFRRLGTGPTAVFLHGAPDILPPRLRDSLRHYKRWLAAPMTQLVAGPRPERSERIVVTVPKDLHFWPDYARMYEEFWASDPTLRERIGMERPEDLEEYRAAGGLRLVWIDGELAGVIGGVRLSELGLRGWRLRERVLGGRWRSSGFGSAALDAVIRDLPFEPDDLLWGTILPENLGSMGSARRLGRVDVGGLWWVEGEPGGRVPLSA